MRARLFAALWLLWLGACEPASAAATSDGDCEARVGRMRDVLKSPFDGATAPGELPAWVAEAYQSLRKTSDPTARAKILDDAVGKTIDGCYGIADAFYEAGAAPAGSRRAAMAKSVPAALESCRCRGVDVESLAFLLRLSPAP